MPARYKYYSDGCITKSHAPVDYWQKATQHYIQDVCLPILLDSMAQNREVCSHLRLTHPRIKKKEKSYCITPKIRRKISSGASLMAIDKKPQENICALCLTFPFDLSENEANEYWSKFAENLRLNYACTAYIAVKELTKIGRPHYHILIRLPYQKIQAINKAWCMTWREKHRLVNNAVTSQGGMIVKSIKRCVRYITKYITKSMHDGTVYQSRCVFLSHNIIDKGSDCSAMFVDFLQEYQKTQKKPFFHWKHPEKPVEIFTFCELYRKFDDLFTIFTDNFG
jgi:hypothetical protein